MHALVAQPLRDPSEKPGIKLPQHTSASILGLNCSRWYSQWCQLLQLSLKIPTGRGKQYRSLCIHPRTTSGCKSCGTCQSSQTTSSHSVSAWVSVKCYHRTTLHIYVMLHPEANSECCCGVTQKRHLTKENLQARNVCQGINKAGGE
jgi:hypothetical protein